MKQLMRVVVFCLSIVSHAKGMELQNLAQSLSDLAQSLLSSQCSLVETGTTKEQCLLSYGCPFIKTEPIDGAFGPKQFGELSIKVAALRVVELEKELNSYTVPESLRLFINWPNQFDELKQRIALLEPHMHNFLTEAIAQNWFVLGDTYSLNGEPLALTILGFKPVTFPDAIAATAHYSGTVYTQLQQVSKGTFAFGSFDLHGKNAWYVVNKDPLLPLRFVYENYKNKYAKKPISKELRTAIFDKTLFNPSHIQDIINLFKAGALGKDEQAQDFALLLGLQPFAYGMSPLQRGLTFIRHPQRYNYLLVPGVANLDDNSAYMNLYGKMMEYTHCRLAPKFYLVNLARSVKSELNGVIFNVENAGLSVQVMLQVRNFVQQLFQFTSLTFENYTIKSINNQITLREEAMIVKNLQACVFKG